MQQRNMLIALISLASVFNTQALLMYPRIQRRPTSVATTTGKLRPASAWRTRQVVGQSIAIAAALPASPAHATLLEDAQLHPSLSMITANPGMQFIKKNGVGIAPGHIQMLGRLLHHLFHTLVIIGTVTLGKGFMFSFLMTPLISISLNPGLHYEFRRNTFVAVSGLALVFGIGNMERALCKWSVSLTGILLNAIAAEVFIVLLSLFTSFFHRVMHTKRHLQPFHDLHHSAKDVRAAAYGHYHSLVDYGIVYIAPVAVLVVAQMLLSGFRPLLIFGLINALDSYFKHTLYLHTPVPQQLIPFIFFTDPSIYDKHAAHHANGSSNFNGPSYDLSFQSLVPRKWRSFFRPNIHRCTIGLE